MNGIGGRTIAEAQANMSYPEFMVWCKFRGKRGSLNQGMRIETAIARLTSIYWNSQYKEQFKMEDFAPHMDAPVLTINDVQDWT